MTKTKTYTKNKTKNIDFQYFGLQCYDYDDIAYRLKSIKHKTLVGTILA